MSQNPSFAWSDRFKAGFAPMDDTHVEFVEIVDAMLSSSDETFAQQLERFLTHAVAHFDLERAWMMATAFPATDCHVDEHDAVLKSVREALGHLAAGGAVAMCRPLAHELVRWFPGHADYMDASLAQWIVKQRMGGKPVVLRRNVSGDD
ncbi:MAG: hemerythrin domain-containing protein [Pseudomonadota bacterium]